jgi:hypothetical protein
MNSFLNETDDFLRWVFFTDITLFHINDHISHYNYQILEILSTCVLPQKWIYGVDFFVQHTLLYGNVYLKMLELFAIQ